MPKLSPLKPREVLATLLRYGFYIHHYTGNHAQLRHSNKSHLRVTVSRHDRFTLPPYVINNILHQAELSKSEFLKLLKN